MAENGNGAKWQIAFWVLTVLVIGSYTFTWGASMKLADEMVCNDRLRQAEDSNIQDKVERYQREIIQRLSRIEAMIEK
jgi:hypothetical protein